MAISDKLVEKTGISDKLEETMISERLIKTMVIINWLLGTMVIGN